MPIFAFQVQAGSDAGLKTKVEIVSKVGDPAATTLHPMTFALSDIQAYIVNIETLGWIPGPNH